MPLYNMTADGDIYEASADESEGEGYERGAEWAEMGDVAVSSPAKLAADIASREQAERDAERVAYDEASAQKQYERAMKMRRQKKQAEVLAQQNEEALAYNLQEDPLVAMAIGQQLSGAADFEQLTLSGHGMTANGRIPKPMGQFELPSWLQQTVAAVAQGAGVIPSQPMPPSIPVVAAPPPVSAVAPKPIAPPKSNTALYLGLAAAAGIGALLLLKKK